MHCFYSEHYLVTVHRDDCPAFQEIRERYAKRNKPIERPALLLYRIISGLVDSFFPILSDFDDRIDELEDAIFTNASDAELQEIFAMKRLFVGLRKAISPQRDMFASMMGGVADLPGMTEDDERYFRDVYDHLIRISELIDTYRDLLTSSMDVYLSTVSNRMNVVMKQLTIIATIFLPLSWITGFFGQNFGFLVRHIAGWEAFVVLRARLRDRRVRAADRVLQAAALVLSRQPSHGPPALPGDSQDHQRDHEPDDRVGERRAQRDETCAGKHAEADEAVGAGMVPVRDQRRAVESPACSRPDLGCELVAGEADHAGRCQPPEVRERVRVDEPEDRLDERHDRADEDRPDDGDPGPPLAASAAQEEGHPERDCGHARRRSCG